MAGLEALLQAGMVSLWGKGGTGRIHSARRERVDALARLNLSAADGAISGIAADCDGE